MLDDPVSVSLILSAKLRDLLPVTAKVTASDVGTQLRVAPTVTVAILLSKPPSSMTL